MQSKLAPRRTATPQIKLRSGLVGGQTSGQANGGTWYGGVFYPDYSGSCSTAQPPTNQGGTWFGGVFYPDYSGTCSV
jgi:hypothetical protein